MPENPLRAVAVNVTDCALPPATRLRLVTLAEKVKSGLFVLLVVMLLVHPVNEIVSSRMQIQRSFAPCLNHSK